MSSVFSSDNDPTPAGPEPGPDVRKEDILTLPETMHAYAYTAFGAPDVLQPIALPVPRPCRGQVLVRLHASGLNPHDTKKRSGWLGGEIPAAGIIPHSDGAGYVVAAGAEVSSDLIGARVMAFGAGHGAYAGTAADYVLLPAENVLRIPDSLSFIDGAALGVPAVTACYAVFSGGSVASKWVLVHGGAGAVGRAAVDVARWAGARVIATVSSQEKAAIARDAGAEFVLNYRSDDIVAAVSEITGGKGTDLIVDVDFGANLELDAACVAENGRVASYSATSNRTPVLPYYGFAMKGVILHFVQAMNITADAQRLACDVIAAMLAENRLAVSVAHTLDLSNISEGHRLLETGHDGNKVIFEINS